MERNCCVGDLVEALYSLKPTLFGAMIIGGVEFSIYQTQPSSSLMIGFYTACTAIGTIPFWYGIGNTVDLIGRKKRSRRNPIPVKRPLEEYSLPNEPVETNGKNKPRYVPAKKKTNNN